MNDFSPLNSLSESTTTNLFFLRSYNGQHAITINDQIEISHTMKQIFEKPDYFQFKK